MIKVGAARIYQLTRSQTRRANLSEGRRVPEKYVHVPLHI
jgi:hypothetical protein